MEKLILRSCEINYEEEVKEVLIYLEDKLTMDEFETIFDHARDRDRAYFQDREGHHYVVEYKNGEFFLLDK